MAKTNKIKKVGSGTSKKDKVTVHKTTNPDAHTVVADSDLTDKKINRLIKNIATSTSHKGSGKSKKGSVTVTKDHYTGRHRVKFTGNGTSTP